MKHWLIAVVLGVIWVPPTAAANEVLTNEDIVTLTEAGFGPSVIVAKIVSSSTAFDTTVVALVALADKGVSEEVVAAMIAAQPKAIPGSTFRERLRSGDEGPEMVVIPAGSLRMGCLSNDDDCLSDERPVHPVTIARPFAISVHEVTFEDYDRFTYPNKVDDEGWGRGRRPVINVSWDDAKEYVTWLSSETGAEYRLLSEAEWEYAARAGSTTMYSWGNAIGTNRANCYSDYCGDSWEHTAPVGSFAPNGFGLYDMHGNVWEWVEDCWNDTYSGAPADGSVWQSGECAGRVFRGGSWISKFPRFLRAAYRFWVTTDFRDYYLGFRVARTLAP